MLLRNRTIQAGSLEPMCNRKKVSPERALWTSSTTAAATVASGACGASSGSRCRSSKNQSGEGGVSQEEELAGRGGSGGEAETEEKSRDVVRESKGQASAETAQASPGPEVGGSRSIWCMLVVVALAS